MDLRPGWSELELLQELGEPWASHSPSAPFLLVSFFFFPAANPASSQALCKHAVLPSFLLAYLSHFLLAIALDNPLDLLVKLPQFSSCFLESWRVYISWSISSAQKGKSLLRALGNRQTDPGSGPLLHPLAASEFLQISVPCSPPSGGSEILVRESKKPGIPALRSLRQEDEKFEVSAA